jgi:cytochrome P450
MAMYPEVQRKAHAEIDAVVGQHRLPDFNDRDSLPYVNAMMKEVMRWNPVAPLGSPFHFQKLQAVHVERFAQAFHICAARTMNTTDI